jgi:hypothetical protein
VLVGILLLFQVNTADFRDLLTQSGRAF